MTIEEKAKRYDEALKRAKFYHGNCPSEPERRKLEKMFPMLRESKDDRIRKSLIKFLTDIKEISESGRTSWAVRKEDAERCKSFLAFLERQKEPKHDATDAKSERVIKAARRVLNNWLDGTDCPDVSGDFVELEYAIREYDGEVKQKEQKQAQTSEEKEYIRTIKSIISDFIRDKKPENLAYYQRIYDWLDGRHVPFSCSHENGKPLYNWKPSEEPLCTVTSKDE